jgi:GNAT superfamily N-acetyltransferase
LEEPHAFLKVALPAKVTDRNFRTLPERIEAMSVENAAQDDLDAILQWLKREYEDDGNKLWCNKHWIERAFKSGELWVIRRGGEAVAFQVGDYGADIACVRSNFRGHGLGTALFAASLERSIRDDVNVLFGECSPRESLTFWEKMGFEQYQDPNRPYQITIKRLVWRDFKIPADLPRVKVTIGFYPECALYGADVHQPITTHDLNGGRQSDGTILLPYRVIGLTMDEPRGSDLVTKITVAGVDQCFCKAKHEKAERAGMRRERSGNSF